MYDFDKVLEIERNLDRWQKDLKPEYGNSSAMFFGRIFRPLKAGLQKIYNYIFGNHEWQTKQERYLEKLRHLNLKIDGMVINTANKYLEARVVAKDLKEEDSNFKTFNEGLLNQISKMEEICDLLLKKTKEINPKLKEDKVDPQVVQSQKDSIHSIFESCQKQIDLAAENLQRLDKNGEAKEKENAIKAWEQEKEEHQKKEAWREGLLRPKQLTPEEYEQREERFRKILSSNFNKAAEEEKKT